MASHRLVRMAGTAGLGLSLTYFAVETVFAFAEDKTDGPTPIDPTPFRLGSGAIGNAPSKERRLRQGRGGGNTDASPLPRYARASPFIVAIASLCMMMPGGNLTMGNVTMSSSQASVPNSRDFNYRIPPYWTPEFEQNYSFRAYMTDISIWILLTDLQPHQQAAAIVMRLGGAARELARMISPQEMMTGGMLQGQAVDPVTYCLGVCMPVSVPLKRRVVCRP